MIHISNVLMYMTHIPHQLTENVKLLHKIVIRNGDRILLLKRSQEAVSRPGCWDLPGGNSEWPSVSESSFDLHAKDVVREIKEETSIEVDANLINQSALVYFSTYFDAAKQIYTVICGWKLVLDQQPQVILSHEHSEYIWADYAHLDSFDFGDNRGEFVKEVVRRSMEHES